MCGFGTTIKLMRSGLTTGIAGHGISPTVRG